MLWLTPVSGCPKGGEIVASYDLNEILKRKAQSASDEAEKKTMDLGDAARVKVLSPMRQVMKRFFRNRLAMFGLITLAVMFAFSFLGPIFYPYGQKQVFEKYDTLSINYAHASIRTEYTGYSLDESLTLASDVTRGMNSSISKMESAGITEMTVAAKDGGMYSIEKLGDKIYALSQMETTLVATAGAATTYLGNLSFKTGEIDYVTESPGEDFATFARNAISGKEGTFEYNGETYSFTTVSYTHLTLPTKA